ncbi:MAG TPA: polyribonucleotide nucleotidyltransferase [Actinomycetota bacterium]|nr:polyribonucleotide nucleotidyltransferase [Actinomycetota bacterium]
MDNTSIHQVERKIGEPVYRLETGRLAMQADGAVHVQCGETTLLVAATAAKKPRVGTDFFPLTIDFEERMYAAGKIPGGFFRREGRSGEKAILSARLLDRPLRPCFPDGFRNDVHVVVIVQAVDQINPPDVPAINAASCALMLSGIPFDGPVGACRLAHVDGNWVVNPTFQQSEDATFEIVVAGRRNEEGVADILMVEAGATEKALDLIADGAPEVTEEVVAGGLEESKTWILEAISAQEELVAKAGVKEQTKKFVIETTAADDILSRVKELVGEHVGTALQISDKEAREHEIEEIAASLTEATAAEYTERSDEVTAAYRKLTKSMVRDRIVNEGVRIDGRGVKDIREITCEVGLLPKVHGTGLFTRGQTQVMSTVTLGMLKMEQMLDDLGLAESKRYMHHYNDPPFSYGEAGFMRGPGRRAIGHGALAEKALLPVIPNDEEFPYALRVVSEVLSSNGSTSMASVCGSTLCLMDAGVPIKAPVAGIAMGLIKEGDKFVTLTDILGAEDAYGDMDFKVAGTETMVTALQLDTKITGVPSEVLGAALEQAREARLFILNKIKEALPGPREELNQNAPRIIAFKVPVEKIGEVIGPKGKKINEIIERTGVEIDIEDDGTVRIGARENGPAEEARRIIEEIAHPHIPEVGERFMGKVVKIMEFGAFVNITGGTDGLLHISKLGGDIRIHQVEDVLSEGDEVEVEVGEIDQRGKISLVPVNPLPRVAELPADYASRSRPPREGGRDRDRDRGPRRDRPDRDRGPRRERPDRDRGPRPPRDE